jgi:hypothetical protein
VDSVIKSGPDHKPRWDVVVSSGLMSVKATDNTRVGARNKATTVLMHPMACGGGQHHFGATELVEALEDVKRHRDPGEELPALPIMVRNRYWRRLLLASLANILDFTNGNSHSQSINLGIPADYKEGVFWIPCRHNPRKARSWFSTHECRVHLMSLASTLDSVHHIDQLKSESGESLYDSLVRQEEEGMALTLRADGTYLAGSSIFDPDWKDFRIHPKVSQVSIFDHLDFGEHFMNELDQNISILAREIMLDGAPRSPNMLAAIVVELLNEGGINSCDRVWDRVLHLIDEDPRLLHTDLKSDVIMDYLSLAGDVELSEWRHSVDRWDLAAKKRPLGYLSAKDFIVFNVSLVWYPEVDDC